MDGVPHQMAQRVLHRAGLGMPGIEEHQHQIGQVDDVIGNAQRRGALGVGVESRRIDEYLAAQRFAPAGPELEVGVDPASLAGGHALDVTADLIEGEARVGVEGEAGQGARRIVGSEADHRELVVHGLIPGRLEPGLQEVIDERRLPRREGSEHRDHRPPGDLCGERFLAREDSEPVRHRVELAKALHDIEEQGVLVLQVRLERRNAALEGGGSG